MLPTLPKLNNKYTYDAIEKQEKKYNIGENPAPDNIL